MSFIHSGCIDKCKDINCNNGFCEEGLCNCQDGWSGENCSDRASAIFNGAWQGQFNCEEESTNATLNILDDPDDLRKISMNTVGLTLEFNGLTFDMDDTPLHGTLNNEFTGFTIDTQKFIIDIPNNPGIAVDVYGNGTMVDLSTIVMLLNVKNDDFGAYFFCDGTVTK